ncbi:hypothetical protein ABPG74_009898 [Tetrahymena malaccensis]
MMDGNCFELSALGSQKNASKYENYHSQQQKSILSLDLPLIKSEYPTNMIKNHIQNYNSQHLSGQELFQQPKDYFAIFRLILFYIIMFFGILIGSFIIFKLIIILFSFMNQIFFEKSS